MDTLHELALVMNEVEYSKRLTESLFKVHPITTTPKKDNLYAF